MPARIAAVALVVPDYDSAIAFYVGQLGFRLTEDVDLGRKRWVTVEPPGGGARLLLARAEGPLQDQAVGDQAGGRVFLFLQTDDFARDHAAMLAAGVIFEEAPRHEPYGMVAVWRDPFGNRWDLLGPSPLPVRGVPPYPLPGAVDPESGGDVAETASGRLRDPVRRGMLSRTSAGASHLIK